MKGRTTQPIRHRRDGLSARYVRLREQERDQEFAEWYWSGYDQDDYDGYDDFDDWDQDNLALIGEHFALVRATFYPNEPLRALRRFLSEPLPAAEPMLPANLASDELIQRLAAYLSRLVDTPSESRLTEEIRAALGGEEARQVIAQHLPKSAEALCLFAPFWCRSPLTWSPESGVSLQEHLFATYPVPAFLIEALNNPIRFPDYKWLCWFILLGRSASLKAAGRVFGWDIPGKFTHFLPRVPEASLFPTQACLYAEVLRLGGTATDYQRLMADGSYCLDPTDLSVAEDDFRFWEGAVFWLIRHREELSDTDAGRVLAWARHCHTEFLAGHESLFRWRGRSVAATLERARIYHDQQHARWHRWHYYAWPAHGWDSAGASGWSITELTNSDQLIAEGAAMQHCVWSYGWSCQAESSAIFSVRYKDQRRVTVEVNPKTGELVQVRGSLNRDPDTEELQIVALWQQTLVRCSNTSVSL